MKTEKRNVLPVLLTMLALGVLLWLWPVQAKADEGDLAGENLFIENICVTGKTEEEVVQVMQAKLQQYAAGEITVNVGRQSTVITAGEMGLTQTNPEIVQRVMKMGNKGNIWQRYNMRKYMDTNDSIVFEMNLAVNEDAVRQMVEARCVPLNIQRQDMTLQLGEDGALHPTDKTDGEYVDVDRTVTAICDYMNNDWHGGYGEIDATITIDPATGDAEKYSKVTDVLGHGVTTFTVDEENEARNINLAVGVSRINGTIVYPGEEFSALSKLEPFLPEAGYVGAPSYEMGSVIDTYGGGACQVSTTLYRAVLEAELLVTERCAHSMIVSYVEPAMDAAVAEGIKDLRFVNDTDAPIYIEGSVYGNILEFTIYGHETRDPARTLGFESEVIQRTEPETEFKLDANMEMGEIDESAGHEGLIAQSYKIVYMNGEEISREPLNWSEYKVSNHIYTIGTKGATGAEISAIVKAGEYYDIGAIYAITGYTGENSGTDSTQIPANTETPAVPENTAVEAA